jgi:NitT/TauT family transport system ATP-binding protein
MSLVTVRNVSHAFAPHTQALKDVSFEIKRGELVCIFGPNGCGKTTLLNVIAGVLKPSAGSVTIGNQPPERVVIGYVFQNYRDSLLPWKTNLDNIAFSLELRGITKEQRRKKAAALVEQLGLAIPLGNFPYQSSGGEQQVVALLREVLAEPQVILMDEPFSALHQRSRIHLKVTVQKLWQQLGLTIVFVSHDVTETIQMADRVLMMRRGEIEKDLAINLPRIRTEESVYSDQFRALRETLSLHL